MATRRGGSPPHEKAGPSRTGLPANHSTTRAAILADLAAAAGYQLAVPCEVCGHALTRRASVLAGVGPRCAHRLGVV
ncbi:DUF6011 domain-containing protein [Mycolicibacter senuensis]|uniref:DUF6011 domain-containing protein n=1 Tax=Mycolicibacter senuensis TaxID=386913 RepID=UPI003369EE38